jgi:non-ribosomal peptide synthetase-like protein
VTTNSVDCVAVAPVGSDAGATTDVDRASGTEGALIQLLADITSADGVTADSNFFDDLGADSMVMARFCARVRKRADLPSVSMKDIYRYPTVRSLAESMAETMAESLAESLAESAPAPVASAVQASAVPSAGEKSQAEEAPAAEARLASAVEYLFCGALQLLCFLGYAYLAGIVASVGYEWISAGVGVLDLYLRAVLFGGASLVGVCLLPVLAKWILIGRWKPTEIRIWSLRYVRFWLVQTLVRASPIRLFFVGTPVYAFYLRALGAKIGRRTAIFSANVPVCADLLTIGADSVIRKEAFLQCYRAEGTRIQIGPVTLGRGVYVGEKAVLDIDTAMGDGAQLGHTSSLHAGQSVPAGERWHGSPALPTEVDYQRVEPAECGTRRRVLFGALAVLKVVLLFLPVLEGGLYIVLSSVPALAKLAGPGVEAAGSWQLYAGAAVLSVVLFLGGVLASLVIAVTVPRALNRLITPDQVYPLYGFRYGVYRAMTRMTNRPLLTYLFGDSSYIVNYLRWLGYDLSEVVQTGANFGMEVVQENPYLCSVGTGTMVADGLSIINGDFSSSSFRLSRAAIGPRNFLGNNIAYPAGGRTGDNCLLATKVMIPLDGEVREGVGLLGSPCFEIPRSVERDATFDHLATGDEFRRRLRAKNWYDFRTMGFFLFARWLQVFLITALGLVAVDLYDAFGSLSVAVFVALSVMVTALYLVLVERVFTAFRPLKPSFCSIYDPYFWWHERLWKVPEAAYFQLFSGTPFKNVFWRMMGVRIGKRVYDDGCYLTERTLVAIGDGCALNAGSKVQCHSQEDGTFKSDHTVIEAGCTLGVGALVHYGVTMGTDAVLAPDSFLMKGEDVPAGARWGGNPAREIRENRGRAGLTRSSNGSAETRMNGQSVPPRNLPGQDEKSHLRDDQAHEVVSSR